MKVHSGVATGTGGEVAHQDFEADFDHRRHPPLGLSSAVVFFYFGLFNQYLINEPGQKCFQI
jgi:hypothetical protein